MTTIIIPKKISREKDLVAISKEEYEEFSSWQKTVKKHKTFVPTEVQKRALIKARNNRKKGIYMTLDELKKKLDFTS